MPHSKLFDVQLEPKPAPIQTENFSCQKIIFERWHFDCRSL